MKKLNNKIDMFCYRHPRFGIPNLMLYIVIGNVVVYFLSMLSSKADATALDFLAFNLNGLLHGEVWRLVTFVFVPEYSSPFALIISLYFYYWIGSTLEQYWGTPQFNIYFFSGIILTVLYGFIIYFATGINIGVTAEYVYLSMFFSFAALFPDMQVLLFFIIPVKMKWLALVDAIFFVLSVVTSSATPARGGCDRARKRDSSQAPGSPYRPAKKRYWRSPHIS